MCRWGAVALAGLVTGAGGLLAQGTTERQEQLRERIRILEERRAVAQRLYDEAAHDGQFELTDTIVSGSLVIVTRADMRTRARDAATAAWSRLRVALGPDSGLVAPDTYVVVSGRMPSPNAGSVTRLRFARDASAAEIERVLLFRAEQRLLGTMGSELKRWFAPGGLDSLGGGDLGAVYVELVTAAAPAGRDCFLERMDGCREYLGLPGEYDPLERWYGPAERVRLAQAIGARLRQRQRERWEPAFEPCLTEGDEPACHAILHSVDLPRGRGPASDRARRTLQQLSRDLGGTGAFGRLLTARDSSIEGRLEAAAGLPLDSLLMRWRQTVIARGEGRPPLTRATAWVALIWVALFGAIAGRSSRWGRG